MQIGEEFLLREVDAVRVKGKKQPVIIFELLGWAGNSLRLHSFLAEFAEALQAYKERQWEKALLLFSQLARAQPNDGPTQIYLERCRLLMASPPSADWDGVFVMEGK
jgi:adenylate cyclase